MKPSGHEEGDLQIPEISSSSTGNFSARSSSALSPASGNKVNDAEDIQAKMEHDDVKNNRCATNHILLLPDEILQGITNHLGHGDRLVARQVCTAFNRVVSSSRRFISSTKFSFPEDWAPIFPIFVKSTVLWQYLEFHAIFFDILHESIWSQGEASNFRRLSDILGLELHDIKLPWYQVQKFLVNFPKIKSLHIVECQFDFTPQDGWFQSPEDVKGFHVLLNRIEVLYMIVADLTTINFCMQKFTGDVSVLRDLHIYMKTRQNYLAFNEVPGNLYELLKCSQFTLENLFLKVPKFAMQRVIGALFRFCSMGVAPEQQTEFLKLKHLSLTYCPLSRVRDPNYNFLGPAATAELLPFLKEQSNLTTLCLLPIYTRDQLVATDYLDIVTALNITRLSGKGENLNSAVFQQLSNAKHLGIDNLKEGELIKGTDGGIYPELRSLVVRGINRDGVYLAIVAAFPNLTHLNITKHPNKDNHSVSVRGSMDQMLQIIIQHLTQLRSLVLAYCDFLSDFGIAGIREADVQKLLKTNGVYLKRVLSDFGVTRSGVALSSLKNLHELVLEGTMCSITDVGIHYGLNFEDLRRFQLRASHDIRITDWGLVELGTLNPSLEYLSFLTDAKKITDDGIKILQSTLHRTPPRKFTVVIIAEEALAARTRGSN